MQMTVETAKQMRAYTTREVPLHQVKPGSQVEHDGRVFKVFRFLTVVKPGGWVAIAVARDAAGGWESESVGLYYANRNATVLLVCGGAK